MKIGLLGGTFNPIHMGHLVLAQECWAQLELDKVIFVPTYIPPHKDVEGDVCAADRLNMMRIALEGDGRFEISTYEIDKKDTSYTVDTIKHFREKFGEDAELFFLTGSDWAGDLSSWKDIDQILELAVFVIATRPGYDKKSRYEDQITRIGIPEVAVSSTVIREKIKNREPIDYLVPDEVIRYIRNKGLYRE
jgi:nicotinate-nucleotide adenylyltransferase